MTPVFLVFNVLSQVEVDAETECAVDKLSHDGCIKPLVKFFDSSDFVDFTRHIKRVGRAATLRAQLNSHLNHVYGLNGAGGCHS